MKNINVLLIEDEPALAMVIKETLETRGFCIHVARDGVEGWVLYHKVKPDVCVVDVMMPRKSGYSLVEDIRKIDDLTPIIFLTAKTQTEDVLRGLEIGADDYIKKPFSLEELILRINRICRRRTHEHAQDGELAPSEVIAIGDMRFNYKLLQLSTEKVAYNLSQREAELMYLLAVNQNKLVDRKTALLKLWGNDSPFNARSMDVYITRLRKYLSDSPGIQILNIRGQGFKLIS